MKRALVLLLLSAALPSHAEPFDPISRDVAWMPPADGLELNTRTGEASSLSLASARRLTSEAMITAGLAAGQLAWIRLGAGADPTTVRFFEVSREGQLGMRRELRPVQVGPRDFLVRGGVGPRNRIGLQLKAGAAEVDAQIWIGFPDAPEFRWENWEEDAKDWAAAPTAQPPSPPSGAARGLVEALALSQQLLVAAAGESRVPVERAEPLLRAEALLWAQPYREPLFPYFYRYDLTSDQLQGHPLHRLAGRDALELGPNAPFTFDVDGPGTLRLDLHAGFEANEPAQITPFKALLQGGGRILAVLDDEVSPLHKMKNGAFSSNRRITFAAPPGPHRFTLQVSHKAYVSLSIHRKWFHADDLLSRGEDIRALLEQADRRSAPGVLGLLMQGELAWIRLDSAGARHSYSALLRQAHSGVLRAFALMRLAALSPSTNEATASFDRALKVVSALPALQRDRLRDTLVAEEIDRRIARGDANQATALAQRFPEALERYAALIGPAYRSVPSLRSLSLPRLEAAVAREPLDGSLAHRLRHEWWSGSRWTSLPTTEQGGAHRVDLLAPADGMRSCAEALVNGAPAYVALGSGVVHLSVDASRAPPGTLQRFHLIAVQPGQPRLGEVRMRLDGQEAFLPTLAQQERIPLALAAGEHELSADFSDGKIYVPCTLAASSADPALWIERRFSSLDVDGAKASVELLDSEGPGFSGLEVRGGAGTIVLSSDRGVLGRFEVFPSRGAVGPGEPATQHNPDLIVPIPPGTHFLEVLREKASAPLLVRVALRRSLGGPRESHPRAAVTAPSEADLRQLLQLSARVQAATSPQERALARFARAEQLVRLNALTPARPELERALAELSPDRRDEARALLASLDEAPLIARRGQERSLILAPGSGLLPDREDRCLQGALQAPLPQRAGQLEGCGGALSFWAIGRLAEEDGRLTDAFHAFARAYQLSGKPALARQAALDGSYAGKATAAQAFPFALAAEQKDPDGRRVVERLRQNIHFRPLGAVDEGIPEKLTEPQPETNLAAALANLSWKPGTYLEVRPGASSETALEIGRPATLWADLWCDDDGALKGESPPCVFEVSKDGVVAGKPMEVDSGTHVRTARMLLEPGGHRLQVKLTTAPQDAHGFVRLLASRPMGPEPAEDGRYPVPVQRRPAHYFTATPLAPIRLTVEGPTALRIDALLESPGGEIVLRPDAAGAHDAEIFQGCSDLQGSRGVPFPYRCSNTFYLPLTEARVYHVEARTRGGRAALAFSVRQDEVDAAGATPSAPLATLLPEPLVRPGPPPLAESPPPEAWQSLNPPLSDLARSLGALQLQQLLVAGTASSTNPTIGDRYLETSLLYRKKPDGLPIWLLSNTSLRTRPGFLDPGTPTIAQQLFWFIRFPPINLRWLVDLRGYAQSINGTEQYSFSGQTYLERSFEVAPFFFILPRLDYEAHASTLGATPPIVTEPIDPDLYDRYRAKRPQRAYAQLLLWWVPFVNAIMYTQGRVVSDSRLTNPDTAGWRAGLDYGFSQTEISAYYGIDYGFPGPLRNAATWRQKLAGELDQYVWVDRNNRLAFRLGGFLDPVRLNATVFGGFFWEFSLGRGLDDYSTPEINLPQQLGHGRGIPHPEFSLQ